MNNRHYSYIMNTELLFLGDGNGYNNLHNVWLLKNFYGSNIYETNNKYYIYEKTQYSSEDLKEKSIKQIGTTVEHILSYTKQFNFDSLKKEYQIVFKYCYEIYSILKNDYIFKKSSMEHLDYISNKFNINELRVNTPTENHFIKIKKEIIKLNDNIETYTNVKNTSNEILFPQLINEVNKYFKNKKKNLIDLDYYNDFDIFLIRAKELGRNLIHTPDLDNILKFLTFDSFSLCNNLSEPLYCDARNLLFLILNNIHFIEVKDSFSTAINKITKYQPLQDFYIDLLTSYNEEKNDLFKITYTIETLYPIMQGRHQHKMELIGILSKYFFNNLPILRLEDKERNIVESIKDQKIYILLECYKEYKAINIQSAVYLQDILESLQVDITDLTLMYDSCRIQGINEDLQKTIENFLGNSLRNNIFDETSPFIGRDLIQK